MNLLSQTQQSSLKGHIRKPHVNSACIGCGACIAIAGEVFTMDDEGLSCVIAQANYENMAPDIDDSIAACPVAAISWQQADENGAYLDSIEEHVDIPE